VHGTKGSLILTQLSSSKARILEVRVEFDDSYLTVGVFVFATSFTNASNRSIPAGFP
jgi:hypothetical protein